MKNVNKVLKAFSLAELMVLLLLISIVMAATMPIISKRAKFKQKIAAASSATTCIRPVLTFLPTTTLTYDITSLSYYMVGGGGGSCYGSYTGGGGGSSAILVGSSVSSTHDLAEIVAAGGDGAGCSSNSDNDGKDGVEVRGTISSSLLKTGNTLTVYAGGGGGSGGWTSTLNSYGGGGGSGYFGGGGGYQAKGYPGGGGTNKGGTSITSPGSSLKGGDGYNNYAQGGQGVYGGETLSGSSLVAGTGGGFGGRGGDNSEGPNYASNCVGRSGEGFFGTGKGGTGDPFNYGLGGEGGSVILIYTTTASTCFL